MNAPDTNRSTELRDVPGYEGLYAASEDGRIWAYPRTWNSGNNTTREHGGLWLSAEVTKLGYLRVTLAKEGIGKRFSVHRLVAMVWLPNPAMRPFVNHLNGIKSDNRPTNLAWCTQGENERHAWATGLKKSTEEDRARRRVAARLHLVKRKFTDSQVATIRSLHSAGASANSIAKRFGCCHSTICRIVSGVHYADAR